MSSAIRTVLVAVALVVGPRDAAARCGDLPGDAAEVAAARAEVETTCICASAPTHAEHVRCASRVVRARVAAQTLRPACRASVIRCASRSTCGRAGTVGCCGTTAAGRTRCRIVDAGRCTPPHGGTACEGSFTSCCDACAAGGCATTTTTPVTTTTSTTLRDCIGGALIDPQGTITTLPRGMAISVPVRVDSFTGGIFDIFMHDNGDGGQVACPPSGCSLGINLPPGGSTVVNFMYTAASNAPATITLTVILNPHSIGITCGPGSFGAGTSRIFPTSGP
jgi:hypothetical protein